MHLDLSFAMLCSKSSKHSHLAWWKLTGLFRSHTRHKESIVNNNGKDSHKASFIDTRVNKKLILSLHSEAPIKKTMCTYLQTSLNNDNFLPENDQGYFELARELKEEDRKIALAG